MSNLPNGGDSPAIVNRNKIPSTHNRYDLSYSFTATERFGECNPFLLVYGYEDDMNCTFRTAQLLRTMSLASPLLQDMRKNMDFYMVPDRALLPHTLDLINDNPVQGDDIDASLANTLVHFYDEDSYGLTSVLKDLLDVGYLFNGETARVLSDPADPDDDPFGVKAFNAFMATLSLANALFAKDSLFAAFRMPLHKRVGKKVSKDVADFLSQGFGFFHGILQEIHRVYTTYSVVYEYSDGSGYFERTYDFSQLSERMRFFYDYQENPLFHMIFNGSVAIDGQYHNRYAGVDKTDFTLWDADSTYGIIGSLMDASFVNQAKPINIKPIVAYQLACAEYFTNDKIDYIYSAMYYRLQFEAYAPKLTLNGHSFLFDGFSAITLSTIFSKVVVSGDIDYYVLGLVLSLFTRKRSLRYVDYFVGARVRPLAVGDVNVTVDNDQVAAVDISKGLQSARFLLAVNRIGPKAKSYLPGILGGKKRTEDDVPVKVGHIDEIIYGIETQNTGAAQVSLDNSITTNLTSRSSNFAFQTDLDEKSMIIGIATYEIRRFYTEGWDKHANIVDRFDMFNPYFQYVGDQEIHQSELYAGLDDDLVFGYQNRNMEDKIYTDYAIGDFMDTLKGWIFAQSEFNGDEIKINPDFIRAHQCELDRYFLSLTGTTPESRYHFICKYDNKIEMSRFMVFSPQILG